MNLSNKFNFNKFNAMFETSMGQSFSTRSKDDVEAKVGETNVQVEPQHGGVQIVDAHEENDLSRSLSQRHIQMIALAGAIVRYLAIFYRRMTDTAREPVSSSVLAALYKPAVHLVLYSDTR